MGMFDSLYDEHGTEWQTKAFDRNLDVYHIGDTIVADSRVSFQVEVCGGRRETFRDTLATIHDGVLASIDDERDPALLLLNYDGHVATTRRRP